MATGSTSATEFASDSVQFYEKDEWGYSYVVPRGCNLTDVQSWNSLSLPTASSLGAGIVVEDTIMLCEGYTSSGVRECYQLIEGQGIQARPPLPIPNGGRSSMCTGRDLKMLGGWLPTPKAAQKISLKHTFFRTPPQYFFQLHYLILVLWSYYSRCSTMSHF